MEAQFPHYDACAVKIEETAQPAHGPASQPSNPVCVFCMGLVYVLLCSLDIGETFLPYIYCNTWVLNVPTTYMHQHIEINPQQNPQVSAYPRLAVLLPVRCVRVLHSRVPPTPVSQTGEAGLAAREIGVWRSH